MKELSWRFVVAVLFVRLVVAALLGAVIVLSVAEVVLVGVLG